MSERYLPFVLLLLVLAPSTYAQRGDRGKEKQPETSRNFELPDPAVRSPAEALKSFRVAPGFRVEIAAAEPLVEDPVAVAWDADGRMWVVEMRGYMPNVDGKGENAPIGSVAVLQDTDGDGRMDRRTTFLDQLVMPRAIAMVKGGVLIAEPPVLWYCRDTDGDLKCDVKVEAFKGYARQGPVEHTDNGLLWTLDNWMYNAKSSKRIRFRVDAGGKPVTTVAPTIGRGQWGITADNYGRLYHNSNSNYLSADALGAEYFGRNPNLSSSGSKGGRVASDQKVHAIRPTPGVNRGYKNNFLDERGRIRSTTATCGPGIYRGDQFPAEYLGHAFVPEPSGNVVAHFAMAEDGGRMRGKHTAYEDPDWGMREFLASTDERFRPINCYTGPDGCLYVVDMYRGILQHRVYVTSFLRKQILERKLDKPVGLGRIYRIVHEGKAPARPLKLSATGDTALVKHLAHANGWVRDAAQRLLVEHRAVKAKDALRELASGSESHLGRLHALWALSGIGLDADDYATLQEAVRDKHVKVASAAVRVSEPLLERKPADDFEREERDELLHRVLELAGDERDEVRLQVALSLSGTKAPLVGAALRGMLLGGSSSIRAAVLSGLHGRELEFLRRLSADPEWQGDDKAIIDVQRALAACVVREGNAQRVAYLLDDIAKVPPEAWKRQVALLDAIHGAAFQKGKPRRPMRYETQPRGMVKLLKSDRKELVERAKRLEGFVVWGAAAKPPPPPPALTKAEQARFDAGKALFLTTCAVCHQPSGLGEEGKAPPLVDSPFLLGPPGRLVRIVLQGVAGPIKVHGRVYDMEMPPLKGFNDEQIAAILTYARRAWEHGGSPIDAAAVAAVRKATAGREAAWTEEELLEVKGER